MHIIVYGAEADRCTCVSCLDTVAELQYRQISYTHTDNYDKLIEILAVPPLAVDIVIVTANGADGMEAVRVTKTMLPKASVIWFTDDENFGAQSYRFGCTYFAVKPITGQLAQTAVRKYLQERIG